jgi:hypothetical protein
LFDGDKLHYLQQDRGQAFAVEVLYLIYDATGTQVEGFSTSMEGILMPERFVQARTNGYMFSKGLVLKPGVYQARVGVREAGSETIGTTTAWIEIPDLKHSTVALSSLMFLDPISQAGPETETAAPDQLKRIAMAQGIRLFPQNSTCNYAFRVFGNMLSSVEGDLTVKTELLKNGNPVNSNPWHPLEGEIGQGQVYVSREIKLEGLEPGLYELSVSVKDARSKKTAQRTALFGID